MTSTSQRARKKEVTRVVQWMRLYGSPTFFAIEGPVIAAYRCNFCLSGALWEIADEWAREITKSALKRVGAKRPDAREAAHNNGADPYEWPVLPDERLPKCLACGAIVEGAKRFTIRWCSRRCEHIVLNRSGREFTCGWCNVPFNRALGPSEPEPRYCSTRCSLKARHFAKRLPQQSVDFIKTSDLSRSELAMRYRVSLSTIKKIRAGTYGEVPIGED